jgi:hypothetical protein
VQRVNACEALTTGQWMTAFYCGDLDILEVGWGSEAVGKQIVRFG